MKLSLLGLGLLAVPLSEYEFKGLKGLSHQDCLDIFDGKKKVDGIFTYRSYGSG